MIGIDMTRISRFVNANQKLIEKILSVQEIEAFSLVESKETFLATRWAIKEAIYKVDNKYQIFNKINIEKINNRYLFENFQISISHEGDYLIAVVISKE